MIICLAQTGVFASAGSSDVQPDSEVFEHKEAGLEFSIRIPPKWKAEPGAQRFAVTLKPSAKAERIKLPGGLIADPSITVAAVKKPVTFDQQSLDKVAAEIEENFTRYNGLGTGFQIFQKNLIDNLPGGKKALLYYVSFSTDGAEAGQAILITGNESARYRVTLSDHRLNFDRNLELYYPYMVSISFQGQPLPPETSRNLPFGDLIRWAAFVLVGGGLVGFLLRVRRASSGSRIQTFRGDISTVPTSLSHSSVGSQSPEWKSDVETSVPTSMVRGTLASDAMDASRSVPGLEHSTIPMSRIGMPSASSDGHVASEVDAVFTAKDLSAPPQSAPLSQVVDESSAPPHIKKRWQIFTNKKK